MKKYNSAALVFFNGKSNAGGAERMVQYLDEYLLSKGIETTIIDEALLLNTFIGQQYKRLFKYKHFQKRRSIYLARFASAYLWLHKRKGRLVFSNGESTPFFPVDFVMNNGCYHQMELDYGQKEEKLSRMANLQRIACIKAKKIITVAANVKDDLVRHYGIPDAKIEVVTNPVNTDYFYPLEKEDNNIKTVGYIGRLEEGKGLKALLQLADIIEQSDAWQLLIACNNPSNTDLFSHYTRTRIQVGLTIENINKEAYSQSDIIFYPSLSESFGMVTIEALSAGIPIVASPVGIASVLAKRNFPGVYIFNETINDKILDYFNILIHTFADTSDRYRLHEMVKSNFGISTYRQRLDEVIGPSIV